MQLIALVYKDQHVHKLERLLNDWLETSLSESSEDNESNTSPQDQNGSCSSPALTSAEPTDDSCDGRRNRKHSSCKFFCNFVTTTYSFLCIRFIMNRFTNVKIFSSKSICKNVLNNKHFDLLWKKITGDTAKIRTADLLILKPFTVT